jgi:hypothetical protein
MSTLSRAQVRALDPYAFLAVLGKRVIHPGGRASTDRLLTWADVKPGERVLDIGWNSPDQNESGTQAPSAPAIKKPSTKSVHRL